MSLIQEALRRKQQEEMRSSGKPLPHNEAEEAVTDIKKPGGAKEAWPAILGVILLVLLALGAGSYLIVLSVSRFSLKSDSNPESAAAPQMDEEPAAAIATPSQDEVAQPISEQTAQEEIVLKQAEPELHVEADPPQPTAQIQASPLRKPAQPSAARWPQLKLSAVLSGPGEVRNAALINGKMFDEGAEIDGVILKSVEPDGVWLQLENEKRFLGMGGSL